MTRNIAVYNSLNHMNQDLGQTHLTIRELKEKGITDILIRGEGKIKFSLLVTKSQAIDIINGDFTNIIEEKIPGFAGVYGYFGASRSLINDISPNENSDLFIIFVDFEGIFWSVNSGLYEGMVVVTSNFRGIEFNHIIS